MATRSGLLVASAAAAIGIVLVMRRRHWPRSRYLSMAADDESLIARRTSMIEFFLQDIEDGRIGSPPPRPSVRGAIRFCTWNVNVLCGPDWNTPAQAADVAKVVRELDADVLVLQEVPIDTLDTLWDAALREPIARVRELDALLSPMGYTTLLRSKCENATLLATRLAVTETEAFTLDESGPTASINGDQVWTESRACATASKPHERPSVAACKQLCPRAALCSNVACQGSHACALEKRELYLDMLLLACARALRAQVGHAMPSSRHLPRPTAHRRLHATPRTCPTRMPPSSRARTRRHPPLVRSRRTARRRPQCSA